MLRRRASRRSAAVHRHRVAMRPKARARGLKRGALVLAAVAVVAAAGWAGRRARDSGVSWSSPAGLVRAPGWLRVRSVEVAGAPEALAPLLRKELGEPGPGGWGPLEPARAAARLLAAFPCLAAVRRDRDWGARGVRFEVNLRRAVAAVNRGGPAGEWLSDDGVVFRAPPGVYDGSELPIVDLGRGDADEVGPGLDLSPEERPRLTALLSAMARPDALPAPLAAIGRGPAGEGWEARLSDGTRLAWGGLDWPEEKLSRLAEVLRDASGRYGRVSFADLRWFADGRILIRRPGSAAAVVAAAPAKLGESRGGVRGR